ncbi:MAG: hypothetical protein KKB21_00850 [Nanoarchaeota archaeon]|nr:hypothetical protein [Nanoarchaeota archaeon]MBU4086104.1 hypothetical protein [Nanoarchaeota archaeon]
MKKVALVLMVAGISSRFGGRIKQFAKVTEKETLIEYSLKQALKSPFSKIIFVVGNKTEAPFKEMFGSNYQGIPVYYALQKYGPERDKPWGTTDALVSAKPFLDCPFIVCNGDDIYGENTFAILLNHLQSSQESASIGYKLEDAIPENGAVTRGIFQVNGEYVSKITEKLGIEKSNFSLSGTSPSDTCSQNIWAFHSQILETLSKILEKFKREHQGDRKAEALLPTDISNIIETENLKLKIYPTPDKWTGITNPEDEETVRNKLSSN